MNPGELMFLAIAIVVVLNMVMHRIVCKKAEKNAIAENAQKAAEAESKALRKSRAKKSAEEDEEEEERERNRATVADIPAEETPSFAPASVSGSVVDACLQE